MLYSPTVGDLPIPAEVIIFLCLPVRRQIHPREQYIRDEYVYINLCMYIYIYVNVYVYIIYVNMYKLNIYIYICLNV